MNFDPDSRDRQATARLVKTWISDYLYHEGPRKLASRLSERNAQNRDYGRYTWRLIAPRSGGGLQLQIGTQSFGCLHFRKDFIGCLNCGLPSAAAGRIVTSDEIMSQINAALKDCGKELDNVKQVCIQGDGSFLSPAEVPQDAVYAVTERLKTLRNVRTVTMETRFDLVEHYFPHILNVKSILNPEKRLEVALGLESASEFVRNVVFRKGSSRGYAVDKAFDLLAKNDIDVLLYVFIKPALLTEAEAIFDSTRTLLYIHSIAGRARHIRWTAALQPAFVQPDTLLAWMHAKGAFLPPFLWSVAEIIKRSGQGAAMVHLGGPKDYPEPILTAANRTGDGSACGCSSAFYRSLLEYNRHQSVETLGRDLPQCGCRCVWEDEVHFNKLSLALEELHRHYMCVQHSERSNYEIFTNIPRNGTRPVRA